jgi:hypothetical protein
MTGSSSQAVGLHHCGQLHLAAGRAAHQEELRVRLQRRQVRHPVGQREQRRHRADVPDLVVVEPGGAGGAEVLGREPGRWPAPGRGRRSRATAATAVRSTGWSPRGRRSPGHGRECAGWLRVPRRSTCSGSPRTSRRRRAPARPSTSRPRAPSPRRGSRGTPAARRGAAPGLGTRSARSPTSRRSPRSAPAGRRGGRRARRGRSGSPGGRPYGSPSRFRR